MLPPPFLLPLLLAMWGSSQIVVATYVCPEHCACSNFDRELDCIVVPTHLPRTLTKLHIHDLDVQELPTNFITGDKYPDLDSLKISKSTIRKIKTCTIHDIRFVGNNREIIFQDLIIDTIDAESIVRIENLIRFSVLESSIGSINTNAFHDWYDISDIYMFKSHIANIRQGSLRDISLIKKIHIDSCNITQFYNNAFANIRQVTNFQLQGNTIAVVDSYAFSLSEALDVKFVSNVVGTLKRSAFGGFATVSKFTLQKSTITNLEDFPFDGSTGLNDVYVYDNTFEGNLPGGFFPKSTKFHLYDNRMESLECGPGYGNAYASRSVHTNLVTCDCKLHWAADSTIYFIGNGFKCTMPVEYTGKTLNHIIHPDLLPCPTGVQRVRTCPATSRTETPVNKFDNFPPYSAADCPQPPPTVRPPPSPTQGSSITTSIAPTQESSTSTSITSTQATHSTKRSTILFGDTTNRPHRTDPGRHPRPGRPPKTSTTTKVPSPLTGTQPLTKQTERQGGESGHLTTNDPRPPKVTQTVTPDLDIRNTSSEPQPVRLGGPALRGGNLTAVIVVSLLLAAILVGIVGLVVLYKLRILTICIKTAPAPPPQERRQQSYTNPTYEYENYEEIPAAAVRDSPEGAPAAVPNDDYLTPGKLPSKGPMRVNLAPLEVKYPKDQLSGRNGVPPLETKCSLSPLDTAKGVGCNNEEYLPGDPFERRVFDQSDGAFGPITLVTPRDGNIPDDPPPAYEAFDTNPQGAYAPSAPPMYEKSCAPVEKKPPPSMDDYYDHLTPSKDQEHTYVCLGADGGPEKGHK